MRVGEAQNKVKPSLTVSEATALWDAVIQTQRLRSGAVWLLSGKGGTLVAGSGFSGWLLQDGLHGVALTPHVLCLDASALVASMSLEPGRLFASARLENGGCFRSF